MRQVFHKYSDWECFKSGLWRKESEDYDNKTLPIAIEFTGNHILYGQAMDKVIMHWEHSCEHFLSNVSINRRAWLGHAAVCLELGIPEYITRKAWWCLTEKQRVDADSQADRVIKLWERRQKYKSTLKTGSEDVIQEESQMRLQLS